MNPLDSKNKSMTMTPLPQGADSQLVPLNLAMTGMTGPMPVMPGSGTTGSGDPGAFTMGALVEALQRRWLLGGTSALLAAVLAVGAVLAVVPPRYTVPAAVQIHSNEERPILKEIYGNEGPDFTIVKGNQAAMIKSPTVLRAAAGKLKLSGDEATSFVRNLETGLKTDFLLGPEILRITVSGDEAKGTSDLANAVVNAFLEENKKNEDKRRREKLQELETNQQTTENMLRVKKALLRKYLDEAAIDDPKTAETKYHSAQSHLAEVRKDSRQVQLDLVSSEVELQNLKERQRTIPTMPISKLAIQSEVEKMQQAKPYLDQMDLLHAEIKYIEDKIVKSKQEPLIRVRTDQIERLRQDMHFKLGLEVERKIRADYLEQNRLEIGKAEDRIGSAKRKKELLDEELRLAEEKVARLTPNQQRLPAVVEALQDEVKRQEEALNKLGAVIAIIRVEPQRASRVSLWFPAEEPTKLDTSRQIKFGGVAGLGAFGLALFGVGFVEMRTRRISGAQELKKALGMNVIGTVPPMPARARRGKANSTDPADALWQHQLAESVDALRSVLMHARRTDNIQVIMITSAVEGEGKTTLASQLAASLARALRNTLLIDGDLRNPATHSLFNLPIDPGFSEVLRGEVSPTDAIKPTPLSRLWLMPAGQWDQQATQALAQDSVHTMFESLKQQFEFIIVDSCPVLPVADTLSLGQHVDAVLFSVLRNVSRVPTVEAAQQRLSSLGVRTLGAVVIGARSESGSLAYYAKSKGS